MSSLRTKTYIFKIPNGETISVLVFDEPIFKFIDIKNQVYIANIIDDILFDLDIMQKCQFMLELQGTTLKVGNDTRSL